MSCPECPQVSIQPSATRPIRNKRESIELRLDPEPMNRPVCPIRPLDLCLSTPPVGIRLSNLPARFAHWVSLPNLPAVVGPFACRLVSAGPLVLNDWLWVNPTSLLSHFLTVMTTHIRCAWVRRLLDSADADLARLRWDADAWSWACSIGSIRSCSLIHRGHHEAFWSVTGLKRAGGFLRQFRVHFIGVECLVTIGDPRPLPVICPATCSVICPVVCPCLAPALLVREPMRKVSIQIREMHKFFGCQPTICIADYAICAMSRAFSLSPIRSRQKPHQSKRVNPRQPHQSPRHFLVRLSSSDTRGSTWLI